MELTCPACSARYSVPTTAIPVGGRIVRCSNCRAEWRAMPEGAAPRPEPPKPAGPAPAQAMPEGDVPSMKEAMAALTAPAVEAMAPAAPPVAQPTPIPSDDRETGASPAVSARRDPNDEAAHALAMTIDDEPEPQGGSGFLSGFALVTIAALLALTAYLKHGEIANAVPQLEAPLSRFVVLVNEGRTALAEAMARLVGNG